MTCAVIRTWYENPFRKYRKRKRKSGLMLELEPVLIRAFMPKVFVDLWYADSCEEEDDWIGQWADDGGAVP